MSQFDHWQKWGIDLSDSEFAAAWMTLGLVPVAAKGDLDARLANLLGKVHARNALVPWTFPKPPQRLIRSALTAAHPSLPARDPEALSQVWRSVPPETARRARLRIRNIPSEEPLRPWLRLLWEAEPSIGGVSLAVTTPRAQWRPQWPLRLGYLTSEGGALVAEWRKVWPANEQTVAVHVTREQIACDVLVYVGSTRALLQHLLGLGFPIKANLILLAGSDDHAWGAVAARFDSILAETRASGYLWWPEPRGLSALTALLQRWTRAVTHNLPMDVALREAIDSGAATERAVMREVVLGLSAAAVQWHLSLLVTTINKRLTSQPKEVMIDLSRVPRQPGWVTMRRAAREEAPAAAPAPVAAVERARRITINADRIEYHHESDGGATVAGMSRALSDALAETPARAPRFLQQRSFVRRKRQYAEAANGFVLNAPALVKVRIGPQDVAWNALAEAFPIEELPPTLDRWTLQVWLTEPQQLASPLRAELKLPAQGASTEAEFRFKPRLAQRFEGRISVQYRGRVLQTALLVADVLESDAETAASPNARPPTLESAMAVRWKLSDLAYRRAFDVAFVLNHSSEGRALAQGLSADHAWVSDLDQATVIAKDINSLLSAVAKSVADYAQGFDGEKGRALLVKLAQAGAWLKIYLLDQPLGARGNRPDIANQEFIQIVSTRSDAVVPFEFIYMYQPPADTAALCPYWREGVASGSCRPSCDQASGQHVCPMGFWGLQKVIERHALTPELAQDGKALFLQSEPDRRVDTLVLGRKAVIGASGRVQAAALDRVREAVQEGTGIAPEKAADWDAWATLVKQLSPSLMVALPHTDGRGFQVSLEIGNRAIKTINLTQDHVRPAAAPQAPLIALIGCDVAGTAEDYGHHVVVFRAKGAAVVVATIATVFGEHAAEVSARLVEGLLPAHGTQAVRLGEALRSLKRQSVLDNLLMPLCLVAYGDADWKFVKGPAP